jgi:hypothetical protein
VISQQEINRKTGVDRKTIRKYGRLDGLVAGQGAFASKSPTPATGSAEQATQACSQCLRATSRVDQSADKIGSQWHGDLPGFGGMLWVHA